MFALWISFGVFLRCCCWRLRLFLLLLSLLRRFLQAGSRRRVLSALLQPRLH